MACGIRLRTIACREPPSHAAPSTPPAACPWQPFRALRPRVPDERLGSLLCAALRRDRRGGARGAARRRTRTTPFAWCCRSPPTPATRRRRRPLDSWFARRHLRRRRHARPCTCTRCAMPTGRGDPRAARRGRAARPGGRRDPAAREHDGRAGGRPARRHDGHRRRSGADLPGLRRRRCGVAAGPGHGRAGAGGAGHAQRTGSPTGSGSSTDPAAHAAVRDDLAGRHALIADGHHRYATYRERQRRAARRRRCRAVGPRPRPARGHARIRPAGACDSPGRARIGARRRGRAGCPAGPRSPTSRPTPTLRALDAATGFAVVLTDGYALGAWSTDPDGALAASRPRDGDPAALDELDVTVVHRGLVENAWGLPDTVDTVGYAHSVEEALAAARESARHRDPAAADAGGRGGGGCGSRRPDAAQVDAVHAEAGVRARAAPACRPARSSLTVSTSTA